MFGDRDVLSGHEVVTIELETRFVVVRSLGVVVERPAAAAAVHKTPKLVLLPGPEPPYPTALAHGAPLVGEEVTPFVERSGELISMVPASFRELVVPR